MIPEDGIVLRMAGSICWSIIASNWRLVCHRCSSRCFSIGFDLTDDVIQQVGCILNQRQWLFLPECIGIVLFL